MEVAVEGTSAIQVSFDPELLAAILENLLLNVYEAKGEGTVVRIKISRDNDAQQVLVKITDNGPGITTELLPDDLFEPFKSSKAGGSGIGLWQVQRIVVSLGATISADNNSDGGARFVIRLTLSVGVEEFDCLVFR